MSIAALAVALAALAISIQSRRVGATHDELLAPQSTGMSLDKEPGNAVARESRGKAQVDSQDSSTTTTPRTASARVRLPDKPVELTPEQLRNEAEQVATGLEDRLPDQADALHVAAMFYAQTRQTAEAQRRWQRCVELSPLVELYYINLAAIAMDRGENEVAMATLEQAQQRGFSSPELMHHWGIALSNAGRFDEAIPIVQKSLKNNPTDANAWLSLGKLQLENGDLETAATSVQQAITLGLSSPSAYLALGNIYARQGKKEQASQALERYRERSTEKPSSTRAGFESQNVQELTQTAVTVFVEAANVLSAAKEPLESERLLLRALTIAPDSLAAGQALAKFYFSQKMLAEERVVRERLLELNPYNFGGYVDLAKVYAQLQDLPAAEAVLKLAAARRPAAVDAFATLAELHWQSRHLPEARWYAEQAVLREERREGYQLLAAICEAQHDDEGKRRALQQADQLRRKSQ
jgi:tetratricopeptide (TPR) repeat protein